MHHLRLFRGVIAHRTYKELKSKDAWNLMRKSFHPMVTGIADELGVEQKRFFEDEDTLEELGRVSKEIIDEEAITKKVKDLVAKHAKDWEKKKGDKKYVDDAELQTESCLVEVNRYRPRYWTECPACGQRAVIFAFVETSFFSNGEEEIEGILVEDFRCYFCGLKLEGHEEVDELELQNKLDQTRRGKPFTRSVR